MIPSVCWRTRARTFTICSLSLIPALMNLDGGGKVRMIEIPHMTGRGLEAVKKKKKKKKI